MIFFSSVINMIDKLLVTIVALCATMLAIKRYESTKSVEGFLGNLPSMQTKVWRGLGNAKGDFYSIPGQYQAMLAPRNQGAIDYGANIRYNVPAYNNLAVPHDPLAMSDMVGPRVRKPQRAAPRAAAQTVSQTVPGYSPSATVPNFAPRIPSAAGQPFAAPQARENYRAPNHQERKSHSREDFRGPTCGPGGQSLAFAGGAPITPAGFAAGNFNEAKQNLWENKGEIRPVSMLPVGDMTTINSNGEIVQPVVFDRFVFANRNSRLRSQGDAIRGDLPIVPCGPDWFRPSVHPNLDLQQGALNVMGGFDNTTARNMAQLIDIASAGTTSTIGGINMPASFDINNRAAQMNSMNSYLGGGMGDVVTTAFP